MNCTCVARATFYSLCLAQMQTCSESAVAADLISHQATDVGDLNVYHGASDVTWGHTEGDLLQH